jgi:hypothetical protein
MTIPLAGQTEMFDLPAETTMIVDAQEVDRANPMAVAVVVRMHRTARQKCSHCGMRRICYYIGVGEVIKSPALCARDAGIR